jgi:hypothetical protein
VHEAACHKVAVWLQTRPELSPDVLSCPPAVAALISKCWAQDPQQRPSAAEVIEEINAIEAGLEGEGGSSSAAEAAGAGAAAPAAEAAAAAAASTHA